MPATRIALQPFENLSQDPSEELLARGLGLDLATELARFATLEVIPPTSTPRVLATLDDQDGVTPLFVLAAGVRRLQDQIRISVQLTQGPYGRQVWADRFDAQADEILAVQDEIVARVGDGASGVALATKATRLNPASADWYTAPTALSLFVMGRYEESIGFALRMPHATLDCPALLAAAMALAGERDRAAVYLKRFLADFEERVTFGRAPDLGEPLRWLLHVDPFRREQDVERVTTGLRLAGLPVDPDTLPAPDLVVSAASDRSASAQFRWQSERWRVVFDGASITLADTKGLRDLASLLACPGEERHCLELAGRPAETGADEAVLDDRARREYRARLAELQREIDAAERDSDLARGTQAREEMEALVEALSGALGLGGRSRALGSGAERARSAVTWRIRSAVKKIAAAHPALGRHLENSIRTGTYCSYQPERPVDRQF